MINLRQMRYILLLPVVVLAIGTVGFMITMGLSPWNAFYFTIVTISTVGYGDIYPTTTAAKALAVFLIVIGIGTFLTILTNVTQWLIQRGQVRVHRHRLNMLIGVFFSEVGNRLLRILAGFDPQVEKVREEFLVNEQWTPAEFRRLRNHLRHYEYTIDPDLMDLEKILSFLRMECDILVRELENPELVERGTFSDLLWAVVHLRDELLVRDTLKDLPESDREHLANDVKRAYRLLTLQWTEYLQHLKAAYPFLFSLALRTNPFAEKPSPVIEK